MYFYELFNDTNGVCNTAFDIDAVRAKDIFGDIENDDDAKQVIDGFLLFNLNDKLVTSKIGKIAGSMQGLDNARQFAVKMWLLEYYPQLKDNKKIIDTEIDNLTNCIRIIETHETNTSNTSDASTGKDNNKVFGFDSVSASDADESRHENNATHNASNTHDLTSSENGNATGKSKVELLKENIEFNKNCYYDIVLNTVREFFTLALYE